jgi:NOL1/NOP2/fmu family ribosome biogenesis protein
MTEHDVRELLQQHHLKWEDFAEWMNGQTIGLNADGSPDYYEQDVARFLEGGGKHTPVLD